MAVLCMCLTMKEFFFSGSTDKSICIWKREINKRDMKECLQGAPGSVGSGFILHSGSLEVWWIPKYSGEIKESLIHGTHK